MNNKGFWICFMLYCALMIADIMTTLSNPNINQLLEVNPLFGKFHSFLPIIIINILFCGFLIWLYHRTKNDAVSEHSRFFVILAMVIVIFMRILAVNNAIDWHKTYDASPNKTALIEQIKTEYTAEVKMDYYKDFMKDNYLIPFGIGITSFILFGLDHFMMRKDVVRVCCRK